MGGAEQGGRLHEYFRNHRGKNLHKWHHYFEVYERHLARFRGRQITLLEIGVSLGGSMGMWRDYFGDRCRIVGMDVDPRCNKFAGPGIDILIGDQADRDFLEQAVADHGPFDIVVDDGGHTSNQQIVSFEALYDTMADEGVYIVEDTHTSFWPEFQDRPDGISFLDYAQALAPKLTAWNQINRFDRFGKPPHKRKGDVEVPKLTRTTHSISFYDSMVVLERRPIPEPWHELR